MQRNLLYFAAFTGMGSVFAATLLVAALVLGATNRAQGPDGIFGMVTALIVEE